MIMLTIDDVIIRKNKEEDEDGSLNDDTCTKPLPHHEYSTTYRVFPSF